MAFLSETAVEQALLDQLQRLGYTREREEEIGPDGKRPERESYTDVILTKRLAAAVARLNPHIPAEARQDALRKVTQVGLPGLLEENRRMHRLLTEGVDVEYEGEDGTLTAGKVALLDFARPANNDWLVTKQWNIPRLPLQFFQACTQPTEAFRRCFRPKQSDALIAILRCAHAQPFAPWFQAHISKLECKHLAHPHPGFAQNCEDQSIGL